MSSNLGKNLTGLALLLAVSATGAYAASDINKLSEVDINATDSGYAVVLKTDSSAQMKKVVSSSDKMYIELKNVKAAEDLSTVYNNVANIENVTIQPVSDNNLKITLQGKDISSSKVYFEETKTIPTAVDSSQSIELSGPVTSYKPVYPVRNVVEVDQTANPKVNAMLTKMHIDRAAVVSAKDLINSVFGKAKDSNILVAFGILLIAAALMFRPKKKAQRSIQIGLSQSLKDSQLQRETALAQRMTAPAAHDRMIGAPAASYGMKAYQQSLKNPYMTSNIAKPSGVSGIPRKPVTPRVRKTAPALKTSAAAAQRPAIPVSSPVVQNTIKTQAPSASTVAQNQSRAANIDSVKFLESITKIYEKNGRTDLAKGLKDNLRKVQTTSF